MKRVLLLVLSFLSCGVPKGETEVASTVSLIQMLAAGVVTSAGVPIASGKARFYLPATLTPVSVYSDTAAATPITAPLTLTAGGTGVAYTKVPTRLILKDSTETTTYFDGLVNIERADQQFIQSPSVNGGAETTMQAFLDAMSTSLGGTAGLWQIKVGAGGTERNVVDVINDLGISVKGFGAVGDGNNNDTTACQSTITFVAGLGGGIVYFPPGTYKIDTALSVTAAGVDIVGAGPSASFIKQTGGALNGVTFNLSGGTAISTNRISTISVTHATTSTGAAVAQTGTASVIVDRCRLGNDVYRTGFSAASTSLGTSIYASYIDARSADASSIGISVTAGSVAVVTTKAIGAVAGLKITAGETTIASCRLAGVDAGLAISGGSVFVHAAGSQIIGTTHGITIASGTGGFLSLDSNFISPDVLDSRTAAPVSYSLAIGATVTPLPHQSKTIRIEATAAITVTIGATAVVGTGQKFTLVLVNNSGGAVTWAFNAQYKLQGGAAPAPATGNLIMSTFDYDPISTVYRETARSASIAI